MKPPCSYPSAALRTDDPGSILLPPRDRVFTACKECSEALNAKRWATRADDQANITVFDADMCQAFDCNDVPSKQLEDTAYPETCLQLNGNTNDPRCWIIADQSAIFNFRTLKLYQMHDALNVVKAQDYSSASMAESLTDLEIPGSFRDHSTFREMQQNRGYEVRAWARSPAWAPCIVSANGTYTDAWKRTCFDQFKRSCDDQLMLWQTEERKKNWGKFVTIFFILVGIGVLGNALGTIGNQIISMVRRSC
jgi:hypothetical protein